MKYSAKLYLLVAGLALVGCAPEQIRGWQANMDNGFQNVAISVDPALKNLTIKDTKFERFIPAQTVGDIMFSTANRGGYMVKGTMVYTKSSCNNAMQLTAKFFSSSGTLLAKGTGFATSNPSPNAFLPEKYTKGTEIFFKIPSGQVDDNIAKVVITDVSCS